VKRLSGGIMLYLLDLEAGRAGFLLPAHHSLRAIGRPAPSLQANHENVF